MSQLVIPFLIGTVALFFLKQPRLTPFEFLINLSMVLVIVPAALRSRLSNDLFFDEEPRTIRVYWLWVIAAFILLAGFRLLLQHGLRV